MSPETFAQAIVSIEHNYGLRLDPLETWSRMDSTPCGRGWVGTKPPGCKRGEKVTAAQPAKGAKAKTDQPEILKEPLLTKTNRRGKTKAIGGPEMVQQSAGNNEPFKRVDKLPSLDEWNTDLKEARNHVNYLNLKNKDEYLQKLEDKVSRLKPGDEREFSYPDPNDFSKKRFVSGTKEQWVNKLASDRKALLTKTTVLAKDINLSLDLAGIADNVEIVDDIKKLSKTDGYFSGGVSIGGKMQAAYTYTHGEKSLVLEYLAANPASFLKKGGAKGSGTAAIKAVIERSMEAGFKGKISLSALPGAVGFYNKLGFTLKGTALGMSTFELSAATAKKILKGKS